VDKAGYLGHICQAFMLLCGVCFVLAPRVSLNDEEAASHLCFPWALHCRDLVSTPSMDTDRGTEVTRLQKRRKTKRGLLSWQNLLPAMAILLCMCTMLWFLLRAAPRL